MAKFNKALIGTAAAAAMAISATPAMARKRHDKGIDAGDVIAGALVIGGIAAIASAASNDGRNDRRYYDRRGYRGTAYQTRNDGQRAANQCVNAAQREASRYGHYASVTQIRDIDRTRYGYRVKGRVEVQSGYRGRGYSDRGKFTCYVDRGRVRDVRLSGLGNYR